ncbi:alpha/beta hydrolase-fold protein [Sphingobium sp. CR2-8]|uniref:alpha/beta hydrolase-fold protein n=1 Tax=Sphingobium sp. CR2-8 TaxID=1306534 RepID=UPI002DBD53E3|nr:alpha/beta hydrolase-fold protein [Sphingobium sp. CR2-8]MEC3911417.1 alpha/beta hydrolase-fold protein [Sphingobium sp. CR2-8]
MRPICLATLSAIVPLTAHAAPQPACVETTPLQRRLEYDSVEVDGDRHVLFRLCAPRALAVKLTSSELPTVPNGYDGKPAGLPMEKDAQGYWSVRIATPVKPGPYRFAFNVDGIDMADPQGKQFAEDFRGVRSVVDVPGADAAFQAWRADVPHGLVSTLDYKSEALGIMRRAHIYTPPGYEASDGRRYPVLYLVHGAGDSDDSWTSIGHAHLILDNLIAAGKAKPMIVVMPFGHTPAHAGVERMRNTDFGADLTDTLIPHIDHHFRTLKDPKNRAMAGLSMGGAHTIHFGLTRPDLFGSIGIFSLGLTEGAQVADYRAANDAALKARAKGRQPVFYAFGRDDFLFAMSAPTRKLMDDYGIRYVYRESGGGHDWPNWRNYLTEFAPTLFR